ncbi:ATP-binding protein [Streptomyces misionensis]|uniref:sensor histidine kinase n=1 Tax=Streptomyces misionensis TaxID=67331 RepID=UPI00341FA88D
MSVVLLLGAGWGARALADVPATWAVGAVTTGCAAILYVSNRRITALAHDLHVARPLHSDFHATRIDEWLAHYQALAADISKDIIGALERVRRGESPAGTTSRPSETAAHPFGAVTAALNKVHGTALDAVAAAAAHQGPGRGRTEQTDVFVHIARRLQVLVSRALDALAEAESGVEDPDLLHTLFVIDHLVTRTRRALESLAVLGGQTPRQVRQPLLFSTVLRQAVAEIEQYQRVRVVMPSSRLMLPGYAGPSVIHLLAELVENAAKFSPPETQVIMRTEEVPAGLVVEVEDRGLPMSPEKRARMNQLLAAPDHVDVRAQLADGQTGLLVAARIAQQHGIQVELRRNLMGGTQAVVVLPSTLLVTPKAIATPANAQEPAPSRPVVPAQVRAAEPAQHDMQGPQAADSASTPLPRRRRPSSAAPASSAPSPEEQPPLPRRDTSYQPLPAPAVHRNRAAAPPTADLMAAFTQGQQHAQTAAAKRPAPDGPPS